MLFIVITTSPQSGIPQLFGIHNLDQQLAANLFILGCAQNGSLTLKPNAAELVLYYLKLPL